MPIFDEPTQQRGMHVLPTEPEARPIITLWPWLYPHIVKIKELAMMAHWPGLPTLRENFELFIENSSATIKWNT